MPHEPDGLQLASTRHCAVDLSVPPSVSPSSLPPKFFKISRSSTAFSSLPLRSHARMARVRILGALLPHKCVLKSSSASSGSVCMYGVSSTQYVHMKEGAASVSGVVGVNEIYARIRLLTFLAARFTRCHGSRHTLQTRFEATSLDLIDERDRLLPRARLMLQ